MRLPSLFISNRLDGVLLTSLFGELIEQLKKLKKLYMNESFSTVKITNGLWMEYFCFQPKMSSHMKPSTEMFKKGSALKLNCKNDMKIWSKKYFGFRLFGETRRSNKLCHSYAWAQRFLP